MKLITWNTQGLRWKAIAARIDQHDPDVVCLQEAGNLPDEFGYGLAVDNEVPTKIGTYGDYKVWFVKWDRQGGAGNVRCSLAMLFKDDGGPALADVPDNNLKRPMMKKTIGSYYVCNIHAGGRAYINDAISLAKTGAGNKTWVVAGDFNQDAQGDLSWMKRCGGQIVTTLGNITHPATRTASGTVLDYAVSSSFAKKVDFTGPDYGGSDHRAVLIEW